MSWTAAIGAALAARLEARAALLDDSEHWRTNTARAQLGALRTNLRAASRTEIGREFGFARLARLDDTDILAAFRDAVPVRDYEGYRDQCARMREQGERDVLWPGLVRDFAQTSGTTSGDKFMPVSKQMLKSNYLCSLDIFAHMMRRGMDLWRVFAGRALFLGGSSDLVENEHGVRTGDLSGIVTPLIRWPISEVYSPGPEIALMDDWPRKIEAMAQLAMTQDVRMISGMPSWAGVLLERILEKTGARCIRDVWPDLALFVHGGVRYDPFRTKLGLAYAGDAGADFPNRVELYPASEGFVAIQDEPGEPSLRLCADRGNFFEFVPLEEIHGANPTAHAAWEAEPGQRYVVVLSTCAGLFRYVLGDVVEFDSVPGGLAGAGGTGPARLRIVGRHRLFINAFGENLIVEQIENAVTEAMRDTGLEPGEFTAAPIYPGPDTRPGLELAIELPAHSDGSAIERFGRVFDESLKRQNVDYTTKRGEDLGMTPPIVTPLEPGTYHRWLDRKGKLGGQHKCPRCANNRDILEELLELGARAPAGV